MNQLDNKEIIKRCKNRLSDISSAYGLGDVETVSMPDGGMVNLCFCVNDKYIIRFNTRDVDTPKFRREKFAYDLLQKSSVPIPDVIALDESKTIVPYDFLILEKLPGKNVDEYFKEINSGTLAKVAFNAGEVMAEIHSVECDHFGELYDDSSRAPESWGKYLEEQNEKMFRESSNLGIIGRDEQSRFTKGFAAIRNVLDEVTAPRLVHGDYSFSNVLYSGNKITGVFVFEWCLAGDTDWDIHRTLSYCNEYYAGTANPFMDGYKKYNKLSESYPVKSKLYNCMWMLELSIIGKKFWSEKDYNRCRNRLLRSIKDLENIHAEKYTSPTPG